VATGIPYVREQGVKYGEAERVSPLIRRVMADNPGPYTYLGTGTYLVGRGEVAVVDPGPSKPAEHIDAILGALDPGERITHLVVTHTHSDHSSACRALQERTGAPTYGFGPMLFNPDPDPEKAEKIVFGDPEADADPPESEKSEEGVDRNFAPDVLIGDGDVLQADGWTLAALHTPGHASNHLCYHLCEEGVLFSGDEVMGWSTSVIAAPDGNLGQYMASLDRLLALSEVRRYRPTHGPSIEDPQTYVAALLAHRRDRTSEILAVLDAGPATIAEIVPRLYADVAKRLWRAAASSVYAHMLHLIEIGAVQIEGGEPLKLTGRFTLAR
jgi:glyoxylase-like metal-dependent hydrolase (beta-lactamase superfamily II)